MNRRIVFAARSRVFTVKTRLPNTEKVSWDNIEVAGPRCGSSYIACNGNPKRNKGRVQDLRSEACVRQFKLHTCPSCGSKLEAILRDV